MKDFFEGVVDRGTGKPAQIARVRVAGKTGTSKKFVEGHYETGNYTASFVGFFPVENPQIGCLVMMDNARGANYTGGTTSAPVFRAIAERVLNTNEMFAPALMRHDAVAKANDTATPSSNGLSHLQKSISSTPQAVVKNEQHIVSSVEHVIPDVKGCSVRRAISILMVEKLQPVVNGSGTVVAQAPAAGQPAKTGMKITLTCQPKSLTTVVVN